jgi:hypothetical protein
LDKCENADRGEGECDYAFNLYECVSNSVYKLITKAKLDWISEGSDALDEEIFKLNYEHYVKFLN